MKDEDKTKEQLIEELAALRQLTTEKKERGVLRTLLEEQNLLANERLHTLLSSTSAVIYSAKPYGDYGAIFISENVRQVTGYESDEFLETSSFWLDHVHPDDAERVLAELPLIFKRDRYVYEYRFLCKDGSYIWVRDEMKLVRGAVGKPLEIIGYWIDITERKNMEEVLRMSEEKSRAILENASDAIILGDDCGNLIDANKMAEELLGYTREELMHMHYTQLHPEKELDRTVAAYNDIIKNSHGGLKNTIMLRKDGTAIPIDITATAIKYNDRRVFQASFRDVSEYKQTSDTLERMVQERTAELSEKNRQLVEEIIGRRRIEVELKKERETFFTVLKNYPHGVALVDRNGVNQYVNPEFTKITGYTMEDIPTGRDWFQKAYPVPEYRKKVIDAWKADRMKTGIGVDRHFSITCKDGSMKDIEFRITFLENCNITVLNDITIRKRAEEALRESEQRLSDIIDFLPDATFAVDLNGKVIAWNHAIEEMTGIKTSNMLGKGDYEYALPFYGVRRPILIDLVFVSNKEIEKKYHFIKKEGDVLLAEAEVPVKGVPHALWGKASPLYDSRGNIEGAIESVRDITDRKRAEEALKKRERDLKAKSRNLEELNTALKVLLKQREKDKDELEANVLSNVKRLVMPYIEKLKKSRIKDKGVDYVSILESNMKEIVSPFSHKLSAQHLNLTPKEIQIANLIKEDKTSKEIAALLNTSPGTVEFHRSNIRKKLNIKSKKANLKSYLSTLS